MIWSWDCGKWMNLVVILTKLREQWGRKRRTLSRLCGEKKVLIAHRTHHLNNKEWQGGFQQFSNFFSIYVTDVSIDSAKSSSFSTFKNKIWHILMGSSLFDIKSLLKIRYLCISNPCVSLLFLSLLDRPAADVSWPPSKCCENPSRISILYYFLPLQ